MRKVIINKMIASVGGVLSENTKKEYTKQVIIEIICDHFTSINYTPISIPEMDNKMGILVEKVEYRSILSGTWVPPKALDVHTQDILQNTRKIGGI